MELKYNEDKVACQPMVPSKKAQPVGTPLVK